MIVDDDDRYYDFISDNKKDLAKIISKDAYAEPSERLEEIWYLCKINDLHHHPVTNEIVRKIELLMEEMRS